MSSQTLTLPHRLPLVSRSLGWAGLALLAALTLALWQLQQLWPLGQWASAWQADPAQLSWPALEWRYAQLPRLVLCLLLGGALGLAGALLQQGLGNPLAAPETLGIQSGALLALALGTLYQPHWLQQGGQWLAMGGGALAAALVLALAARRHYSPLALLLAGLLVSLICGALLTLLMLRHDIALLSLSSHLVGSLAQDGWQPVQRLAPALALAAALAALLVRPLGLLAMADQGVRSLGASPGRLRLLALGLAIFLSAQVVSLVGVVSLVALAAPLLARLCGARRLGLRLLVASLFGAALLLLADALLRYLPLPGEAPTGSLVALLGAPLLAILVLRLGLPEAPTPATQGPARHPKPSRLLWLLLGACLLVGLLGLLLARGPAGWQWGGEADLLLEWRLPRLLGALAAGLLLAQAGVIVQRLAGNPLASPEVLGISSSCGLGLILLGLLVPEAGRGLQLLVGAGSAFGLLALLLWWSRRAHFAPLKLLLCGMSLTTLYGAAQSLVLGSGDPRGLQLLSWMSGSTYYVTGPLAGGILALALVSGLLLWPLCRWLALLPLGTASASALGVGPVRSRLGLLALAALLTTAATLLVGPISFVGLLAPHLARQLGLCRAGEQLLGASLLGGLVMLLADWLGRLWLFPDQVPAGLMASLLGGLYFLCCLWRRA